MSAETVEEVTAPEPEEVPAAPAAPTARHRDEGSDAPAEQGTPAGQVALGVVSVLAVGGAGLYSATGVAGLVVGSAAAVVGGGGYAYHRFRRTHPRKDHSRAGSASRHGIGSRTSSTRNPLSGLTSRSGRRATFSAGGSAGAGGRKGAGSGRSGLRMPSLGGAGRVGGKAGGKRMTFPAGLTSAGGRTGKANHLGKAGGKGQTHAGHRGKSARRTGVTGAAHAAGAPFRATGRAGRSVGRHTAHAGRAVKQRVAPRVARARAASRELDARTGLLASQAGRRFARGARRVGHKARAAGGWVDRRTGQRVSTAWRATQGVKGFRASRRRAVAALGGWDAQLTASVVALVALLVGRWKQAKASEETAATKETPETEETPKSVVHGDPPISTTVTCPRCGDTHTVTIPGGHAERIVTCECGYKIRFFRIPDGPFAETAETARTSHPTGRATPTQRGSGMSGMITHATELPTIASSYETEDMMQVKGDLEMLRELPLQVAAAIRLMTERLSADYPIHNDVVESLHVVYEGFAQLANACDEVSNTFQAAHETDITRRLEPRTNEQKWNHQ